tara:strand:+ start:753 stop:1355 length:603 start_codon:yes stop_codon:yes gene_type:complete
MKTLPFTKEKFLQEVAEHKLTVMHDDGIYRHLRIQKPGTSCMHYDIVTYPGYLVYTGDMGSYTFTRLSDMFDFFRDSDDDWGINRRYWSEKCEAQCSSGINKFNFDLFKANLLEYCVDEYSDNSEEQKAHLLSEIRYIDEDEFGAVNFVRDFDEDNEAGVTLGDFWEVDNTEYTHRYTWCCMAIVWAIRLYDQHQLEKAQ